MTRSDFVRYTQITLLLAAMYAYQTDDLITGTVFIAAVCIDILIDRSRVEISG